MSLIVWIKEINFTEVIGCVNTTFPFNLRILCNFLLDTGNVSVSHSLEVLLKLW